MTGFDIKDYPLAWVKQFWQVKLVITLPFDKLKNEDFLVYVNVSGKWNFPFANAHYFSCKLGKTLNVKLWVFSLDQYTQHIPGQTYSRVPSVWIMYYMYINDKFINTNSYTGVTYYSKHITVMSLIV